MTVYHAQCSCGTVRIEAEGEPQLQCYCHCNRCRQYSGAPVNAVVLWPRDKVGFAEGAELVDRVTSEERPSVRLTCAKCHGNLGVDLPHIGMIDIFGGLVRDLEFLSTFWPSRIGSTAFS